MQEALIRTWQRWADVREYEFPVAWVYRALFNLVMNDRRHRHRSVLTTTVPEGRVVTEPVLAHLDLVAALRALPCLQCEALVLHDAVGFTVEEVARAMDVPTGTVKSWLSRARGVVSARLEEYPALPDRR